MGKEFVKNLHPINKKTEMYGYVVNVTRPSSGIHTFVLKWDKTRVYYGMPLEEYHTTVNIPPSNSNKLLLQTDINK